MSRAALWRQEANVKERERHANETFENALLEGRSRPQKGLIQMIQDDRTFNLNPMLLHSISKSSYFVKTFKIEEWSALVDEIYYQVNDAEPWQGSTKTPSAAFCLLLRLFCMRCTEKQMKLMLDHVDSPYIRIIGFLYLRYAADPSIIWDWFQPYLYDEELVSIQFNKKKEIRMGEYVRGLLHNLEYYGTRLPRFPVAIERDIKVKLLQEEKIEERALRNLNDTTTMTYFQRVGSQIQALYGDEENPITWYDAVIDRILKEDEVTGIKLRRPKFVVTFPEYGNTETVTLGEMDMPGVSHSDHHSHLDNNAFRHSSSSSSTSYSNSRRDMGRGYDRHHDRDRGWDYHSSSNNSSRRYDSHSTHSRGRGYDIDDRSYKHRDVSSSWSGRQEREPYRRDRSRSRDRAFDEKKLMEEVLSREKESSIAKGKMYSSRPLSLKHSLGKAGDPGSATAPLDDYPSRRSTTNYRQTNGENRNSHGSTTIKQPPPPKKKTPEQIAAIEEKKRKLLARYG